MHVPKAAEIVIINVFEENWPSEVIYPSCVDCSCGADIPARIIIHNK